jgi:hypothetical protein
VTWAIMAQKVVMANGRYILINISDVTEDESSNCGGGQGVNLDGVLGKILKGGCMERVEEG